LIEPGHGQQAKLTLYVSKGNEIKGKYIDGTSFNIKDSK
jgi:hypothetical protein